MISYMKIILAEIVTCLAHCTPCVGQKKSILLYGNHFTVDTRGSVAKICSSLVSSHTGKIIQLNIACDSDYRNLKSYPVTVATCSVLKYFIPRSKKKKLSPGKYCLKTRGYERFNDIIDDEDHSERSIEVQKTTISGR